MVKNISMKKIFLSLAVFLLLSAHCLAGEWNLSGNLNQGRESFPSVIFNNGNVLVAGGIGSPSAVLSSCEIYEASTGIWSLTDSMTFVRRDFPLVKFRHNGLEKILVAGGTQSLVGEIFNPQSQMWEDTGSMHYWRLEAPAIAFLDPNNGENDLVLFVGGDCENDYTTCEIYNPATGSFALTGSLLEGKCGSKLVYNSELNVIMAIGGWGTNGMIPYHDCEIYDIATGTWTQTDPTDNPRDRHTAIYNEKNATVLVIGSSYSPTNACELYDFSTNIWTVTDTLGIGRWNHCSESLLKKEILVMSGSPGWANTSCELYNYETNEWRTAAPLNGGGSNYSSKTLLNEQILFIAQYCCELYTWNYMPQVSQLENLGLNEATIGETLSFSVIATDPDEDSVSVRIDWDDGEISDWTGIQSSGSTFILSHSWNKCGTTYKVRAQSVDQWYFLNELCHNSISEWGDTLLVTISGQSTDQSMDKTDLLSCYPNPFRISTTISFNLLNEQAENTEIIIYNIKGQEVKTSISFPNRGLGTREVVWDGTDEMGNSCPSGVYLYKLVSDGKELTANKALLLR